MEVYAPGLDWYIDKLQAGERFSFVRYVDGEWGCILGTRDKTCSGHQRFTPDLRIALAETLRRAHGGNCYVALNPQARVMRPMMAHVAGWLERNAPGLTWHHGKVFHQASLDGRLPELVEAMRSQRVVVVGPRWLRGLPFVDEFIEAPAHHAWDAYDAIYVQAAEVRDAVVCVSMGVPAKVLIHQLYRALGEHSWLLDMGSVWDPYFGRESRSLWRGIEADLSALGGRA